MNILAIHLLVLTICILSPYAVGAGVFHWSVGILTVYVSGHVGQEGL